MFNKSELEIVIHVLIFSLIQIYFHSLITHICKILIEKIIKENVFRR